MAKEEYISINILIDRIYRHPLLKDISKESIIDYVVDFMRIVGVPNMFEEKTVDINVKNYRAKLPQDINSVITVYSKKSKVPLNYISSKVSEGTNSYKIQGGVIFTSNKETDITVVYNSIPIDEEGIPKIPDNSSFLRAVEAYIKKNYFSILVETGRMHPTILQKAEQDYAWAVGDCESEFRRMNFDEASSFYNMWKSIFVTKPKV